MEHPFFILQLTDLHFDVKNSREGDFTKLFKPQLKRFLDSKSRQQIDFVSITGDCANKNIKSNHKFAAEEINSFLEDFRSEETKVICCPGNHDIDSKMALELITPSERLAIEFQAFSEKFNAKRKGTFEFVDSKFQDLKQTFENYEGFVNEINAINKPNETFPHYHLYGCHKFEYKTSNVFFNWFNSSWLSLDNTRCREVSQFWKKTRSKELGVPDAILQYRDDEFLSVGKKCNELALQELKDFKEYSISGDFCLGMMHHSKRHLNWFDIYSDKLIDPNIAFYEKVARNDMFLSGHTHGNLLDGKDSVGSGYNTSQSKKLGKGLVVYEVDLVKNIWIKHFLDQSDEDKIEVVFFGDKEKLDELKMLYSVDTVARKYKLNEYQSKFKGYRNNFTSDLFD